MSLPATQLTREAHIEPVSTFFLPDLSLKMLQMHQTLPNRLTLSSPDGVVPSRMVVCLPLLIFPCTMSERVGFNVPLNTL